MNLWGNIDECKEYIALIRLASGPGRVGSRVLRSLRSLLDSSVREEGAAWGGSVGETAASKSRRSDAGRFQRLKTT